MKQFFKSMFTTLMLGLPLILIAFIWLSFRQKAASLPLFQKEPVSIADMMHKDEEIIEDTEEASAVVEEVKAEEVVTEE